MTIEAKEYDLRGIANRIKREVGNRRDPLATHLAGVLSSKISHIIGYHPDGMMLPRGYYLSPEGSIILPSWEEAYDFPMTILDNTIRWYGDLFSGWLGELAEQVGKMPDKELEAGWLREAASILS